MLSYLLAGAMVFGGVATTNVATVNANAETDEIMVASFWTSDNDTTDTVYFSTDGVTFHEICEAFTDATPNDSSKSVMTKARHQYEYADPDQIPSEGGKNGWEASPKVLKVDANGNYIYHATDVTSDVTLHDPSILYDTNNKCFWMISGDATGTGDARRVRIMMSYSFDLINWSFPAGGYIKLSSLPSGFSSDNWDMVAPDFIMGTDGKIYIAFSIGYFALFHNDDPLNDKMYPYVAKVNSITMPTYRDTNNMTAYVADPAKIPEAQPTFTFEDAKQVKLPCMTERANVAEHNHIDASFYVEGGWNYYAIKENGVTNEIWRIKDLANVSDASKWESVCYDAVTGYEGPCLTKYQGQYFLYMDRLSSFRPTGLDGVQSETPFGSEGTWVAKASTDDGLNGYTGWLEENIKEIQTLRKDNSKKANRHGTVITVSGEAAKVVRAAAKKAGYKDSDLYGSVSGWANSGWYQKESYLGNIGPDTEARPLAHRFAKYFYENNRRVGTSRDTDRGVEKCLNLFSNKGDGGEQNWVFFQANGSYPDLDGRLLTGYAGNSRNDGKSWHNQDAEVAIPTDFSTYNRVGSAKYDAKDNSLGDMVQLYKWVRYDWQGKMRKCGDDDSNRILEDQTNKQWYRYDPTYGYMVKGAFGFVNNAGYDCIMWFDLVNGTLQKNTTFTVNGATYYTNDGGFAYHDAALTNPVKPGVLPSVSYPSNVDIDGGSESGGAVAPQHIDGKDLSWYTTDDGKSYWYENGEKQGTVNDAKGVYGDGTNRGREICDNNTKDQFGNGTWFWLDAAYDGAKAVGKEVWIPYIYQHEGTLDDNGMRELANESDAGMGDLVYEYMKNKNGKWVRYDENGKMLKGWVKIEGALAVAYPNQAGNTYYYDSRTGLMAKGVVTIEGVEHEFDTTTGVMIR